MSHNLFFALWPDDDARAHIASAAQHLKRAHAPRGRWIRQHRYHLTLRYLGEHATVPHALLAASYAAGDTVRAAPFAFVLDTAASFANRKIPWWLGCQTMPRALDAIWDAIADGLRAHDVAIDEPLPRAAHVTILCDADRELEPEPITPIEWTVRDFVLVDSRLGAESSYTILRRWSLVG